MKELVVPIKIKKTINRKVERVESISKIQTIIKWTFITSLISIILLMTLHAQKSIFVSIDTVIIILSFIGLAIVTTLMLKESLSLKETIIMRLDNLRKITKHKSTIEIKKELINTAKIIQSSYKISEIKNGGFIQICNIQAFTTELIKSLKIYSKKELLEEKNKLLIFLNRSLATVTNEDFGRKEKPKKAKNNLNKIISIIDSKKGHLSLIFIISIMITILAYNIELLEKNQTFLGFLGCATLLYTTYAIASNPDKIRLFLKKNQSK
ncbi:MAG: hypothetical protein PF542_05745 [Nanoarchaeota archaeon]|jgi:hypothetical protein|nr:hypothetical protein [Nanoarchaeota archaeon]